MTEIPKKKIIQVGLRENKKDMKILEFLNRHKQRNAISMSQVIREVLQFGIEKYKEKNGKGEE